MKDNRTLKGASGRSSSDYAERLSPSLSPLEMNDLGRGESEAVELARRIGVEVLIDDRAARRRAESVGLTVSGTLAVVALASRRKLVAFEVGIVAVQRAGLYVSPKVLVSVRAKMTE